MKQILVISFLFLSTIISYAQKVSIIPQPMELKERTASFTINADTRLVAVGKGDIHIANLFNEYLKNYYGLSLHIVKNSNNDGNKIVFSTKKVGTTDRYRLAVSNRSIMINGDTEVATFYGMQTLIQLLPVDKSMKLQVLGVDIIDEPAVQYRGLHLDVGRHFFPVSFIKKYIDYIALHKMNYFHWHLTEDQGWRIEIKKYPKLTSVGGWRNGTIIGRYPGTGNTNSTYGGFYTQDEVREIVKYAGDRYITVIPEIEMPGHASAAIAAYPYLSCFPKEDSKISDNTIWNGSRKGKQVQQTWGVFDDVFCAGSESTFKFLEDVLTEILPLFPSKYVHIGGDECPKANWKRCSNCQQRMKANGLKDEHELQSYFIQRIEKFLNKKGRTIIGWDEILEGGLAPNAVVMSWRGEEGGIAAAKQNHQVIMSPNSYAYFDHSQIKHDDSITIGGYLPIEKVYGWVVVPKSLSQDEKKFVLGGQANLWTEYITNIEKAEYMLFPRLSALSEALWCPIENRNFQNFSDRLSTQKRRYELWKTNYYKQKD